MTTATIIRVSQIGMYDVVNKEGKDLGQIQTIMLDITEGRIAFVVVAFGGVLGLTDKWFALPWEILSWSPEQRKFIVDMPREILETAPGLDKDKWPDELDLSWLEACYAHFGCAPYWKDAPVDERLVKLLAYSMWEKDDKPEGRDQEYYYRAETILRDQKQAANQSREFASVSANARRTARNIAK